MKRLLVIVILYSFCANANGAQRLVSAEIPEKESTRISSDLQNRLRNFRQAHQGEMAAFVTVLYLYNYGQAYQMIYNVLSNQVRALVDVVIQEHQQACAGHLAGTMPMGQIYFMPKVFDILFQIN